MAIKDNPDSLKNKINFTTTNTFADYARHIRFGDVLRALPTYLRKKAPKASQGVLGTLQAIALPDDAKAAHIFRAYARTATAGQGVLTVAADGATPTTGQIAVAPNGDLVVLAADAILDLDVVYLPEKMHLVEAVGVPVTANVATIPQAFVDKGVVLLLEVEATAGNAPGKKIVLAPGASAPAAGQARLNLAKSTVTFASADAVTSCTIKIGHANLLDLDKELEAPSPF